MFLLLIFQSFTVSHHAMICLWSGPRCRVSLLREAVAGRIPGLKPIISVLFCNTCAEVFQPFRIKVEALPVAWHSISNSAFLLLCFGIYLAGNFLEFSNPASAAFMTWFVFTMSVMLFYYHFVHSRHTLFI